MPDNSERDSVYPDGDEFALPSDLRAAYRSASYLLETSEKIVFCILATDSTEEREMDLIQRATESAIELRSRIKECESSILTLTHEITSVNRETVRLTSRSNHDFPNAHRATLDVAALVCEVIWDGCYRERGFRSEGELYSLPLTVELVTNGLPYIADQLHGLLGLQNWDQLKQQLMIEAATVAHVRTRRRVEVERIEWIPADLPSQLAKLFEANEAFLKLPATSPRREPGARSDGPEPPCWLWWKNERKELSPRLWSLLNCLWGTEKVEAQQLTEKVWRDEGETVAESTLRARLSELNTRLNDIGVTWTYRLKSGYVLKD